MVAGDPRIQGILERNQAYVQALANAEVQVLAELLEKPDQAASAVTRGIEIFVPLRGLIDIEKEVARLNKELRTVEADLQRIHGKLNNQGFLAKAPADVVEKEKAKKEELSLKAAALKDRLAMFETKA